MDAWRACTGLRYDAAVSRSARAQAALDRAVAAVDRELAADLELTAMFDQTKQAFVLENGQWELHRRVIAAELPGAHAFLADLYARLPLAETAMERRGPAGSLRDDDRATVEIWEGDAREGQRLLRAEAMRRPPSVLERLIAFLLRR